MAGDFGNAGANFRRPIADAEMTLNGNSMSAPEKAPQNESIRALVSAAEWQTRVDLAAAYRLVAHYGWDDLIFTHISARVPGPDHHFLLNPYGMMFEEVTASSLVKVDLAGKIMMETPHFINPAGFTIHS